MPELPEVETVRRDLAGLVTGASIAQVSATGMRSIRRYPEPVAFAAALRGTTITSVDRWGKYLLVHLDPEAGPPNARVLVIHLRMSGQLLLAPSRATPLPKHAHVVLTFADGRQLRFVDPRTFGELFVTTSALPELAALGPDALATDLDEFRRRVSRRRARLKPMLLDQRVVAGIGNVYSDEILWRARLRWYRQGDQLRPVEIKRLHESMVGILGEAVEGRGSSLKDAQYVDLAGNAGSFQEAHEVYDRLGRQCRRCGHLIERVTVAQRSHYWCRGCQR